MAIDATELTEALAAARISGSHCQDAADLARQMEALNAVIESTFQTFATEIINIINNGGGGATTPVYILRALVNKVGGVAVPDPANQADPNHLVPFDGWSVLFSYNGDPPTFETGSQVARNVDGRSFQDNEVIKIISFNGTTWLTDKIADDDELIAAYVNKPGDVTTGDTWFYFTGAVAIDDGFAPAGGTGVALNLTGNAYAHNERLVLRIVKNQSLIDAANPPAGTTRAWFVMQDDDDVGGSGGGTKVDIVHFRLNEQLMYGELNAEATTLSSTAGTTGIIEVQNSDSEFEGVTNDRGFAYDDGNVFHILNMQGPDTMTGLATADIPSATRVPNTGELVPGEFSFAKYYQQDNGKWFPDPASENLSGYNHLEQYISADDDNPVVIILDQDRKLLAASPKPPIKVMAVVFGTVPKSAGIVPFTDLGTPMVSPGMLTAGGGLGAWLVDPIDGKPLYDFSFDVINPSYTDFVAEEGICTTGFLVEYVDAFGVRREAFVLPSFDLRTIPGYAKGVAGGGSDDPGLQIPYHSGGEDHFKLDSSECAPPETP